MATTTTRVKHTAAHYLRHRHRHLHCHRRPYSDVLAVGSTSYSWGEGGSSQQEEAGAAALSVSPHLRIYQYWPIIVNGEEGEQAREQKDPSSSSSSLAHTAPPLPPMHPRFRSLALKAVSALDTMDGTSLLRQVLDYDVP